MIPKNTTLRLSLELALLELVIWLLLGVFVSSGSESPYVALMSYSAEHFGEITVAIATTFYVVFTYRLLENSEAQRKYSTEPYLMVRWYQAADHTATQLDKMGLLAEKVRSWLIEAVGFGPNAIDEANKATGDRYLILELSNLRETAVGWIRFAVSGILEISDTSQPEMFWDELHLENLQIGKNESIRVTMVDLFPIPRTGNVTLKIEAIAYGAADGEDVLDKISGDSEKLVQGEFMLTEPKGPQPN